MTTNNGVFGDIVFEHEIGIDMCPERKVALAIEMAGIPRAISGDVPDTHICTPGCDPDSHCGWDECPECPQPYHEEIPTQRAGLFFLVNGHTPMPSVLHTGNRNKVSVLRKHVRHLCPNYRSTKSVPTMHGWRLPTRADQVPQGRGHRDGRAGHPTSYPRELRSLGSLVRGFFFFNHGTRCRVLSPSGSALWLHQPKAGQDGERTPRG